MKIRRKNTALVSACLSFCAVALLAACTATMGAKAPSSQNGNTSQTAKARLYGDYLAASYAHQLGDSRARSEYYSRAFARVPDDIKLGQVSMLSALSANDNVLARALAIEVYAMNPQDGLSRAILGASALSKGHYKKASIYLADSNDGTGLDDINGLMQGWVEVGLGNQDAALESFTQLQGGKYFELIGSLQKAKLYAALGDSEKADEFFKEIDTIGISSIESLLSQVRANLAKDDKDKALALLNAFAAKNGGALTGPVRLYLDMLAAEQEIETEFTPAQSASRALTEPAFGYYAVQKRYESAEMFLRLALQLDPKNDKARLFLASVLEDMNRDDDALSTYMKIGEKSAYAVSARLSEANILFQKDKDSAAIQLLENVYETHPSRVTLDSLGRAHLIREDYAGALPYYNKLIASMSDAELQKNPQPKYIRGICLERLERWEEAVVDMEYVLKYQPQNADALNYLGYTWVDKGVKLGTAFEMIRKAVALEPKSGAIIDSLGWAHYKLGQYGQARLKLEDAVEYSPSSATIVDHLGDVYWKVGRKREAEYQWRRAVSLDPTDKELRVLKAKLKGGLNAASSVE
ncbi:MAG: hypothetical protein COA43_09605 [Robiginitomaculum sp.]|nr:MAG: hypothetical protein COA43_09605 [Robiginitomaculum sp.]